MLQPVTVHGYRYSVYTRILRLVLEEKGVGYAMIEVDPFGDDVPAAYRRLHPFDRVPALVHDGFSLYETAAITRYVDATFDGPALTPGSPRGAARMAQAIAIMDNYGYWPMVRQVYSHRTFRPRIGETPDENEIAAGLDAAARVLSALDSIAAEGRVLNGAQITLADCHLGAMVDAFTAAPEGAAMLTSYPALSAWWAGLAGRKSLSDTAPGLP